MDSRRASYERVAPARDDYHSVNEPSPAFRDVSSPSSHRAVSSTDPARTSRHVRSSGGSRTSSRRLGSRHSWISLTLRINTYISPPIPRLVGERTEQPHPDAESLLSQPGRNQTLEEINREIVHDEVRASASDLLDNGEMEFPDEDVTTLRGAITHFIVVIVLVFGLFIMMLYAAGWVVLLLHGTEPCDVPLNLWMLAILGFNAFGAIGGQTVRRYLYQTCWGWDPDGPEDISVCMKATLDMIHFSFVMSLCFYGFYLTTMSKTCAKTAPMVYTWSTIWIYLLISLVAIRIVLTICGVAFIAVMISAGVWKSTDGADPDLILRVETVTYDMVNDTPAVRHVSGEITKQVATECSICYEEYVPLGELKFTPCLHIFHEECLKNWLKIKRTCPLCRLDLQNALEDKSAEEEERVEV